MKYGLMSFPEFFAARSPGSLHLAPEQQSILGRAGLSVVFRLYFDHLDLNENAHIFSRDTVAQIRVTWAPSQTCQTKLDDKAFKGQTVTLVSPTNFENFYISTL